MKLNFIHKKADSKYKSPKKIVLLHGWAKTASSKSFEALQKELAKEGFESWAVDLPGFGDSPEAPEHYGIPEYAEEVARFVEEEIRDEEYYLFGHSFGGSLSAHIAAYLDPKPKAIILCNSAGIRYKTLKAKIALPFAKAFKSIKSILPKDFYNTLRRNIYYYFIRERDYVDTSDKKEQFVRVTNDDITETFKEVKLPTLIIWGRDDKVTPLSMGEKIHSLVEDSEMEVIEGRHGIPITKATEVAELIGKFI
ncbi:alpha/beta fold hydrolase [Candidatus Dojkabacteria bacterium]|nr:alpha/beta fold hydrolase [Candidatus Dojkabacteria bacterium]